MIGRTVELSFEYRVDLRILSKLDNIIHDIRHHSKTANHFYRLRERLTYGRKLTKKMSENLEWIKNEAIKELVNEQVNK